MKLKSAAGYGCYVKDLNATADFYEKLGLEIKDRNEDHMLIYLNWYRIDFFAKDTENTFEIQQEAHADNKGAGIFLYFSVDDVDLTHKELLSIGIRPASEPKDMSWGNREFVVRDPDGYKLVFFKRKIAKNPLD